MKKLIIKSSSKITETHKYNFKIYLKDGEKINTDFYDLENARLFEQRLMKTKEVYSISEWIEEGMQVNEILNNSL